MKNELILNFKDEITAEQQAFVNLHQEIMFFGNQATEFAFRMAQKLKEMRDSKAYTYAGYESFGIYVEKAIGLKERQAYNYIKTYEELPDNFLQSNAKLGITKLSLLAKLDRDERENLISEVNIQETSVSELKALIKERETQIEQYQIALESIEEDKALEIAKEVQKEIIKAENTHKKVCEELNHNIKDKELEVVRLKKEVEELKNIPLKVETIKDPIIEAKLKETEAFLINKENEVDILKKKLEIASDIIMSKFKFKFEDLQRIGGELITLLTQLDEEKKTKCKQALRSVIGGWRL